MYKRILVVESDKKIQKSIQANLTRHGYLVTSCFDGKTGIETALYTTPDLMIFDATLPDIHRLELPAKLKEQSLTRNIPVILLTGNSPSVDFYGGFQTGLDCFITKPFNPIEFVSFVKRIVKALDERPDDDRPPAPRQH